MRVEPGASFVGLRLRFSCAESDCALVSLSVAVTALWLFSAAIRRARSRSLYPLESCVLSSLLCQVCKSKEEEKITIAKQNRYFLETVLRLPKSILLHSISITKT